MKQEVFRQNINSRDKIIISREFGFSNPDGPMRTKSKIPALPGRQKNTPEEINIHGYPLYSSRVNFYNQYNEQKKRARIVPEPGFDDFLEFAITDDEENRFYNSSWDDFNVIKRRVNERQ